jgi:hypothetical protein
MDDVHLQIQPGPCVVCGEKNYPLSLGGPDICPACDCGMLPAPRLRQQIELLEAEIKELHPYKLGIEVLQRCCMRLILLRRPDGGAADCMPRLDNLLSLGEQFGILKDGKIVEVQEDLPSGCSDGKQGSGDVD